MGTLLVLRHSKSAYPADTGDIDRPLSGRGQRDAAAAGRWLRDQGLEPDLVLCSVATRARLTWDLLSGQLGWAGEAGQVVRFDPRLYLATASELTGIIRETPGEVAILAVIGHNPAAVDLAVSLTGSVGLEFPTSALAVIELGGDWSAAGPGRGTLARSWTPKGGTVYPLA